MAEDAVVDEVCAARRVGSWTAERMVTTARLCAGDNAPATPLQQALLAGATSGAHVDRFVALTSAVVDDVLSPDEIEAGVQPRTRSEKLAEIAAGTARSAQLDTPPQYRAVVEAAVSRVDGAAQVERRRAALGRRDVFAGRRTDDPLASLTLLDDPSLVARVMARLQKRARRLQLARGGAKAARGCPDARIGACRADVLGDLLDHLTADDPDLPEGCETGPLPDDATIEPLPADTGLAARSPQREGFLVVDLETLRGEQDNPCMLDGTPVPAALGRAAAAGVRSWRRMVTDPVTGHLLDYGRTVYLPSALTDFVRQRDGRCIIPYCERPARRCQVDHGIPYPKGPSTAVHCGLLCDRHHPLKTEGYEHIDLDETSGWVHHRTAWGQVLEVCGHPYLPDWDDEPYDVTAEPHPARGDPPHDLDPDPDPPPGSEPALRAAATTTAEDNPPPF
jgi:hypothetical protein